MSWIKCETCKNYKKMWWEYPCKTCVSPEHSGYEEAGEEQDDEPKDRGDA